MPSEESPGGATASQPLDGEIDLSKTALVVYDAPCQEHTPSDPLADVVMATKHIRDNTYGMLDLLEDSLHRGELGTNDDTEEILSLIRSQLNEIYMMAMDANDLTSIAIRESHVNRGKEMQRIVMHYLEQEQNLRNTITAQQNTVLAIQHNMSNLTLQTGLLRGEAMALDNENRVLRQKKEDAESANKVLQNLAKELSQSLENKLNQTSKMETQQKGDFDKLIEDFNKQKSDFEVEKKLGTKRLAAAFESAEKFAVARVEKMYGEEVAEMKEKVDEKIKALDDVMLETQELKAKLEETVEDAIYAVEKRCSAAEELRKLRADYQVLKKLHEKSEKAREEAKGKEVKAVEKQEKTYDKFEKLQLELEAQQKINERLVRDINEAKADSEFFARQAKESGERELMALAEMESMKGKIEEE